MSPAIQFHPIILRSHILSPNFLGMTQVDQSWDCLTINDQRNWGGPLLGVQGQCFTAPKMRFCSDPAPSIIARDPTRLRDPKTQRPGCFLMRTLPFGSEASVLHFNCTARLLHWQVCVEGLFQLLGFRFASDKPAPFSTSTEMLGVIVDIAERGVKKVCSASAWSRPATSLDVTSREARWCRPTQTTVGRWASTICSSFHRWCSRNGSRWQSGGHRWWSDFLLMDESKLLVLMWMRVSCVVGCKSWYTP